MHSCYVDDNDGHFNFKSVMILSTLRCKVDNCDDQDDPAFDQPWLNFTLPPGKFIIVVIVVTIMVIKVMIVIVVVTIINGLHLITIKIRGNRGRIRPMFDV